MLHLSTNFRVTGDKAMSEACKRGFGHEFLLPLFTNRYVQATYTLAPILFFGKDYHVPIRNYGLLMLWTSFLGNGGVCVNKTRLYQLFNSNRYS